MHGVAAGCEVAVSACSGDPARRAPSLAARR
jgi:hypothetical protein